MAQNYNFATGVNLPGPRGRSLLASDYYLVSLLLLLSPPFVAHLASCNRRLAARTHRAALYVCSLSHCTGTCDTDLRGGAWQRAPFGLVTLCGCMHGLHS